MLVYLEISRYYVINHLLTTTSCWLNGPRANAPPFILELLKGEIIQNRSIEPCQRERANNTILICMIISALISELPFGKN